MSISIGRALSTDLGLYRKGDVFDSLLLDDLLAVMVRERQLLDQYCTQKRRMGDLNTPKISPAFATWLAKILSDGGPTFLQDAAGRKAGFLASGCGYWPLSPTKTVTVWLALTMQASKMRACVSCRDPICRVFDLPPQSRGAQRFEPNRGRGRPVWCQSRMSSRRQMYS